MAGLFVQGGLARDVAIRVSSRGTVTGGELLAGDVDDEPVAMIATADVATISREASLLDVLECMVDEPIDHVPVVQDGQLVGICTCTDLLRARSRYLELDQFQPGWQPPRHRLLQRSAPP